MAGTGILALPLAVVNAGELSEYHKLDWFYCDLFYTYSVHPGVIDAGHNNLTLVLGDLT